MENSAGLIKPCCVVVLHAAILAAWFTFTMFILITLLCEKEPHNGMLVCTHILIGHKCNISAGYMWSKFSASYGLLRRVCGI